MLAPLNSAHANYAKGKKNYRTVASAKSLQVRKKNNLAKKKKLTKHDRKHDRKKRSVFVPTKIIVPELEIVTPDGDFHANYDASAESSGSVNSMQTSSQQAAEEFENFENEN